MSVTRVLKLVPVLALVLCGSAYGDGELVHRPVVISLFPSVSTADPDAWNTEADFSFNIVGGRIGAVRAFELGWVFNIDDWDMSGAQVAGVFNIVGGRARGVQVAGAFNFCAGETRPGILPDRWVKDRPGVSGAQVAPVNFCLTSVRGAQVGLVNIARQVDGIQLGAVNVAEDVWGIGLGVVNIAASARGLSLGTVNIADRFSGFALSTVNIADAARGFQLGVVNIAGDLDGEALGIVSIIGNGRRCVSVWADETGVPMVGAKLGSRHIYTTYWMGVAPAGEAGARWISGIGLGGHFRLSDRFFTDIDLSGMTLSDPTRFPRWKYGSPNGFLKLRPQVGFEVTERIAVVAGPTVSLWLDHIEDNSKLSLFNIGAASGGTAGSYWRAWGGLMAGIEFN